MLLEAICNIRRCKRYLGVIQPDGTEETEYLACEAFPDGIPERIAYRFGQCDFFEMEDLSKST